MENTHTKEWHEGRLIGKFSVVAAAKGKIYVQIRLIETFRVQSNPYNWISSPTHSLLQESSEATGANSAMLVINLLHQNTKPFATGRFRDCLLSDVASHLWDLELKSLSSTIYQTGGPACSVGLLWWGLLESSYQGLCCRSMRWALSNELSSLFSPG